MNPIYKHFIKIESDSGTETREVYPVYKDDLAKEYELESNQRFYRAKLSGKLDFIGKDYDYITGKSFDTEFIFVIEKSDDLGKTFTEYFTGKFMKTDCEFNDDDKICTVQPDVLDEYNDVLAGLEKEYNLISLAPKIVRVKYDKRPLLQVYISGESVISNFIAGAYWEQDCDAVTDREMLTQTYHFAFLKMFKEVKVTSYGSPATIESVYRGEITTVENEYTFEGRLEPVDNIAYYMYVKQVWHSKFADTLTVTYEIRRTRNDEVMFRYHDILTDLIFDNVSFDMEAVSDSARGYMHADMTTFSVFTRYMLDVDTIDGKTTYPVPTDDIVENNKNYKKVIPYGISDIVVQTRLLSDEPTEWGLAPNDQYYMEPYTLEGRKFYPIARSTWAYTSLWFNFSIWDPIFEPRGRKQYTLRDAYPLSSCIQVLLNEFAPGITHEPTTEYSQFLYGSSNPISGSDQFTLLLTQKTNVINGEYDKPAQKAPVTLQQITTMLRDCFKCYWYIEDGKFKVEHINWFRNGGSYSTNVKIGADLTKLHTTRLEKKWGFDSSKWSFDKVDMPERYQFEFMDTATQYFEGFQIEVLSKYVTQGKVEDISISNFNPDIDYMLMNPGDISDEGFALFGAVRSGSDYVLPYYTYQDGTNEFELQNGYCSFVFMHPNYWVYDLPARRVRINEKVTYAKGVDRKKKQEVSFPSNSDPDPMQLIKTYIGNGQIDKISITLHSRMHKITLKYDTE